MVAGPSIRLDGVHKRYRIYRQRYQSLKEVALHRRLGEWEDRWVLRGISLEVKPGTTLGLVGPNGAGKSTALKLMARILTPDRGSVSVRGRVSALLELGAGFQLDYTGRENVFLNASLLGLSGREIERRFDEIVGFAELEDHIDTPLRTYSSGMYMRLAFSVAIHVDPEILLVDEILAVGDEAFQAKCLDYLRSFQQKGGTIVLISHSMGAVQELCSEVGWIEHGRLIDQGQPSSVLNAYIDRVREEERRKAQEVRRAAGDLGPPPDVQLGEVRLLDQHEQPASELQIGDTLTLEISYHVNRRLETPVFGVAIFRNDGLHVYGTNTAIDGVQLRPLEQDGVIRLRYPGLPLLAGTYRLAIGIFESPRNSYPLDFNDRQYRFKVVTRSDEEGTVRLGHEWEYSQAVEEPASKRS